MAVLHGKKTRVYANGYDLTAFFKTAESERIREVAQVTPFNPPGDEHAYLAGVRDGTVSLEGFYDGAEDAVDELLSARLELDAASLWNILVGGDVLGNRCYGINALKTTYTTAMPLDDVVAISAELQAVAGLEPLVILRPLGAVTTDTDGTAVDGAAASENGAVGYLQVTAYSGLTSAVIKVQDSADGSTDWQDILTFATVTAGPTAERVAITGTVRQHTRVEIDVTGTGSITLFVGFGRK